MSTIFDLQRVIRGLSEQELSEFRAWFLRFDVETWDRQFDGDVTAGRLDVLAAEARADLRAGRTRPL